MLALCLAELDSPAEQSTFRDFYLDHRQLMYRTALHILKDRHLAEDAVQEAFLSILPHTARLRDTYGRRGKEYCTPHQIREFKLKKKTALRMKRNLKRVQRLYAEGKIDLDRAQKTVTSCMGLLSHCDSYQLRRAIFGEYTETEWVDGWFYLQRNSDLIETQKGKEPSEV